jgi:hypothetical protein
VQGPAAASLRAGCSGPQRYPRQTTKNVDTVVESDPTQARSVALADGPELPLGLVAVQLTEHHGGFGGRVFGEVEPGEFVVVGRVHHADEGVRHLSEGLIAGLRVVDGDREDDLVGLRGETGEVHLDLLIVTLTGTGEVVALVLDRAVGGAEVVEENEV